MPIRLGNINLFVADINRSRRFYAALGLIEDSERSAPPGFVLLHAGEVTLTLQDSSAPGASFGRPEGVEIGFAVEDIDLIRQQIVKVGGTVAEVQQMGWADGFDAADPDGHRLTIYRIH